MIIKDFEGRDWDWDFDKIGVDEWREVKRKLKMTPKAVQVGLDEADPDAMTVAYWTMLQQAGLPSQPLGDNLKPDILKLNQAVGTAIELELADRQAAALAELEAAAQRAATESDHVFERSGHHGRHLGGEDAPRESDGSAYDRFLTGDIELLRAQYLFPLAHLCGIGAAELGALPLPDFALYAAAIDAYLKASKPPE